MNEKIKKLRPIIIMLFIISALFYVSRGGGDKIGAELRKHNISIDKLASFEIEDRSAYSFIATKEGERIKIDTLPGYDKVKAEEYFNLQASLLYGQYESQPTPYPELITSTAGCDDRYKPQEKETEYGIYFQLYAGERFTYGQCNEEQIKYKAAKSYLYCENKKNLFEIDYYIPKEEDYAKVDDLISSFKCL